MYGIVEGVSDRPYVSNSFHCHVTEDVTPIEKQDLEGRFWELCNGGKIQYVRYPIGYNREAIRTCRCIPLWRGRSRERNPRRALLLPRPHPAQSQLLGKPLPKCW